MIHVVRCTNPTRAAYAVKFSLLNTEQDNGGGVSASVNYDWSVGVVAHLLPGRAVPVIVRVCRMIEYDAISGLTADRLAGVTVGANSHDRSECFGSLRVRRNEGCSARAP